MLRKSSSLNKTYKSVRNQNKTVSGFLTGLLKYDVRHKNRSEHKHIYITDPFIITYRQSDMLSACHINRVFMSVEMTLTPQTWSHCTTCPESKPKIFIYESEVHAEYSGTLLCYSNDSSLPRINQEIMEREIKVNGNVLLKSLRIQISKGWENECVAARIGDADVAQWLRYWSLHVVNYNLDQMLQYSECVRAETMTFCDLSQQGVPSSTLFLLRAQLPQGCV